VRANQSWCGNYRWWMPSLDAVRTMPDETITVVDPDEDLFARCPVLDALRQVRSGPIIRGMSHRSRLAWGGPRRSGGRLVIVDQPYRADVLPADIHRNATSRRVPISGEDQLFGPAFDRSIVVQLDWADRRAAYIVAPDTGRRSALLIPPRHSSQGGSTDLTTVVMGPPAALLERTLRHHQAIHWRTDFFIAGQGVRGRSG